MIEFIEIIQINSCLYHIHPKGLLFVFDNDLVDGEMIMIDLSMMFVEFGRWRRCGLGQFRW